MKRMCLIAAVATLALSAAAAWAGGCGCSGKCHCIQPPCQNEDCCDCKHHRMPCLCSECKVQHLIETLCSSCECCERIKAAKKLGSQCNADACACPDVLNALVKALMCDSCWEVRRAAAWSLAMQDERAPNVVAALYIASKVDRHFLVRDRATDGLSILIRCRSTCYKDMFKAADVVIGRIRANYDPTNGNCISLVLGFCEHADGAVIGGPPVMGVPVAPGTVPSVPVAPGSGPSLEGVGAPKGPEPVAAPKEEKEEMKKDEDKKDDDKKEEMKKDDDKKDDDKKE